MIPILFFVEMFYLFGNTGEKILQTSSYLSLSHFFHRKKDETIQFKDAHNTIFIGVWITLFAVGSSFQLVKNKN